MANGSTTSPCPWPLVCAFVFSLFVFILPIYLNLKMILTRIGTCREREYRQRDAAGGRSDLSVVHRLRDGHPAGLFGRLRVPSELLVEHPEQSVRYGHHLQQHFRHTRALPTRRRLLCGALSLPFVLSFSFAFILLSFHTHHHTRTNSYNYARRTASCRAALSSRCW
jgi:hypothetical protein